MPRQFGKPVKYRLRVSYKVDMAGVPIGSRLEGEAVGRDDIDAIATRSFELIQQAGGYDVKATLVTVDQHGNTRQEEYAATV